MISLRRFFVDAFLPALCVTGILYNCLIALNGEEGVRAHALVREDLTEAQADLAAITERRARLERKIALLSRDSLDHDTLDASARRVLGYSGPDEYVISAEELDHLVEEMRRTQR